MKPKTKKLLHVFMNIAEYSFQQFNPIEVLFCFLRDCCPVSYFRRCQKFYPRLTPRERQLLITNPVKYNHLLAFPEDTQIQPCYACEHNLDMEHQCDYAADRLFLTELQKQYQKR